MPAALVISNLHAPDCFGGYEAVASACMDVLEREHGWDIRCHCAHSGRPQPTPFLKRVQPDLTGYFPRGWTHHHALLRTGKHLRENTERLVSHLCREAAAADVTLLFNPRRLSTLQWLPAMAAAKNPIAWISDYWPLEFPDCDKLLQAANTQKIALSPLVMAGAARVRHFYGSFLPTKENLRCIRRAAFVSEFVLKKNAPAFPFLEHAAAIPNGINLALFPFKKMTDERWNTWGFCGRIQQEKGVELALDLFEESAKKRPSLKFLLAGDTNTNYGREIEKRLKNRQF